LAQEEFFREMARLPGGFFGLVEPMKAALGEIRGADPSRNRG